MAGGGELGWQTHSPTRTHTGPHVRLCPLRLSQSSDSRSGRPQTLHGPAAVVVAHAQRARMHGHASQTGLTRGCSGTSLCKCIVHISCTARGGARKARRSAPQRLSLGDPAHRAPACPPAPHSSSCSRAKQSATCLTCVSCRSHEVGLYVHCHRLGWLSLSVGAGLAEGGCAWSRFPKKGSRTTSTNGAPFSTGAHRTRVQAHI